MTSIFTELKRRNVFRVAIAYIVLAWIVLQVGETLAPALRLPEWVDSLLAFFLILGFPIAVFFAWAFELTPDGLRKERDVDRSESITHVTGRKLDFIIIALLAAALAYFAWQHWVVEPGDVDGPQVAAVSDLSIAVMPFINMSSDPEQEYFSDGLSEELLNLLAKIPDLRVTSRSSSFAFKGQDITVPDFATALGVAHVLEGSVRRSGDTIRITAQLIDAAHDVHLWSETWDRQLSDIFAIQDEIAGAVVDQLKIELLGNVPVAAETDPDAYGLYLRGMDRIYQRNETDFRLAEEYFGRALEIDPDYAPAWAGLARAYSWGASIGVRVPTEAGPLARDAAERALAIDPDLVMAISALASTLLTGDLDYDGAFALAEHALEVSPLDANALLINGSLAYVSGNIERALEIFEKISELDPLNAASLVSYGIASSLSGNHDRAFEIFDRIVELSPNSVGTHYYIAQSHILLGNYDEALAALENEALDGFRVTGLALLYHAMGDTAQSDAAVEELATYPVDWAYQRVIVHAYRGETDKAFEWMDTAIEIRDRGLNNLMTDPYVDSIRDDPRFRDALKRMGRDRFLTSD